MDIIINETKINYIDEGSGTPVLLLHGWDSSTDAWKGVIASLGKEYRFVALDFPGCGKSDLPKNAMNSLDYCNLILEFIKATNLVNPIMIGHSNGGRIIIKMCALKMVNPPKIILIDAAGLKSKFNLYKSCKVLCFKTIKRILTLPIIKNHSKTLLYKAQNYFGSADYNSAPPVMRKTLVNLVNEDLTPVVSNITCPTLLIWGDKDTATPLYMAKTLEKLIPDAGLCVLKNTGHFSFIEKPFEAHVILKSFLN